MAKHSTSLFKISLTDNVTDDGDPVKEETDMNPPELSQPQVSSSSPASAPTAGTIELP